MAKLLVFLFLLGPFAILSHAQEFSFVQPTYEQYPLTQDSFLSSIDVPSVRLPSSDSRARVREIGRGRYADGSFLLYSVRSTSNGGSEFYRLQRTNGTDRTYLSESAFQSIDGDFVAGVINQRGELITAQKNELIFFDISGDEVRRLELPQKIKHGVFRTNPEGSIGFLGITENEELIVSDTSTFFETGVYMASRGDRTGVLSVYPGSDGILYGVAYRYMNPFNKGLYLIAYDFEHHDFHHGFLFNSHERNVGFDPHIYEYGDTVFVSAQESTTFRYLAFDIPKSELGQLAVRQPEHIAGFEHERNVSLLTGGGLTHFWWWIPIAEVEWRDTTYASVDYQMSPTLMYKAFLEGRVANVHFGLEYLDNRVDDGSTDEIASQLFSGFAGLEGVLPASTSFRAVFEWGRTRGEAEFTDQKDDSTATHPFEDEYLRIAALAVLERGVVLGLDYTSYQIPSAVGFLDDRNNIVSRFDPEFQTTFYSVIAGIDMLGYAQRYETNLSRPYVDGVFGLGLGNAEVSSSVEKEVLQETGKSEVFPGVFLFLSSDFSLGYIYQRRALSLRGLGLTFQAGYRLKGNFVATSPFGITPSVSSQEVALVTSRVDLMHGPFLQLSLVW